MKTKVCSKCNKEKDLSEFLADARYKDGFRNHCIHCRRKYRDSTRAHRKSYQQRYYEANRDRLRKYKRDRYNHNPVKARESNLQRKYGITSEDWDSILEAQSGNCAICGIHYSELTYPLHTDHDHVTGEVRGLLCSRCNQVLGYFKDSPELLIKASRYLDS